MNDKEMKIHTGKKKKNPGQHNSGSKRQQKYSFSIDAFSGWTLFMGLYLDLCFSKLNWLRWKYENEIILPEFGKKNPGRTCKEVKGVASLLWFELWSWENEIYASISEFIGRRKLTISKPFGSGLFHKEDIWSNVALKFYITTTTGVITVWASEILCSVLQPLQRKADFRRTTTWLGYYKHGLLVGCDEKNVCIKATALRWWNPPCIKF